MILSTHQPTMLPWKKNLDSIQIFSSCYQHHEEYCELDDADDQKDQANWFDDLDQYVFNFKHKIHNGWKNQIISHQDIHQKEVAEVRGPLGAQHLVVTLNHQHSRNCLKRKLK